MVAREVHQYHPDEFLSPVDLDPINLACLVQGEPLGYVVLFNGDSTLTVHARFPESYYIDPVAISGHHQKRFSYAHHLAEAHIFLVAVHVHGDTVDAEVVIEILGVESSYAAVTVVDSIASSVFHDSDEGVARLEYDLRSFLEGNVAEPLPGVLDVQEDFIPVEGEPNVILYCALHGICGKLEAFFVLNSQKVHVSFQRPEMVVGSLVSCKALAHLEAKGRLKVSDRVIGEGLGHLHIPKPGPGILDVIGIFF